jgi:hypothetical protein
MTIQQLLEELSEKSEKKNVDTTKANTTKSSINKARLRKHVDLHVAGQKSEHIKKKKNKANTKEIQIKMSFAIGDVPIKLKAMTAQIDEEVKQTMQTLVQLYGKWIVTD